MFLCFAFKVSFLKLRFFLFQGLKGRSEKTEKVLSTNFAIRFAALVLLLSHVSKANCVRTLDPIKLEVVEETSLKSAVELFLATAFLSARISTSTLSRFWDGSSLKFIDFARIILRRCTEVQSLVRIGFQQRTHDTIVLLSSNHGRNLGASENVMELVFTTNNPTLRRC